MVTVMELFDQTIFDKYLMGCYIVFYFEGDIAFYIFIMRFFFNRTDIFKAVKTSNWKKQILYFFLRIENGLKSAKKLTITTTHFRQKQLVNAKLTIVSLISVVKIRFLKMTSAVYETMPLTMKSRKQELKLFRITVPASLLRNLKYDLKLSTTT